MVNGQSDPGQLLPLWSAAPFAGLLLSIALVPLVSRRFWHDHYGKITLAWSLVFAVPFLAMFRGEAFARLAHELYEEYLPFVILVGALYVVAGNITLVGRLRGTPAFNTAVMAGGMGLASFMGTTGASMVLIRPLLRANAGRERRAFIVVFFIFLVGNIGGALTPLGDPPLFLGFLRGVPFFWTLRLFPQMAVAAVVLLTLYYMTDAFLYRRESISLLPVGTGTVPLRLEGWYNILILGAMIGAILWSGIVSLGDIGFAGVHRPLQNVLRDAILLLLAGLSIAVTPRKVREDNAFSWEPVREVAILFAGIFVTMVPCLIMLQAGDRGALAPIIELVKGPRHYFWATGLLSAALDNAPTYLTFLNLALGRNYPGADPAEAVALLIAENVNDLLAISAGAVFFGALTYIGNAPNLMIHAIAEESGLKMPTFFGYLFKFSLPILVPLFLFLMFLFY